MPAIIAMLGITTADAIAFGMMVLAALAAWKGATRGETARKTTPPENTISIGAGVFADTAAMQAMTMALNRIAAAVEAYAAIEEEEKRDRLTIAIEAMTRALEERDHLPPPRKR